MESTNNFKYLKPGEYKESFSDTQWYLILQDKLKEIFYDYTGDKENKTKKWLGYREEFKLMVADLLKDNKIALGSSGKNWDEERLPIDTIVIHHSSSPTDEPIEIIDALGLIRLYTPKYINKDKEEFGKPVWSGHFYKGHQTFIGYHYIVKSDGTYEHILKDNEIGLHSGNWNYNCRSVAICFLDDLKEKKPSEAAINTAKEIIGKYPNCKILGHREIKPATVCPGNLFLGENGWKKQLLK